MLVLQGLKSKYNEYEVRKATPGRGGFPWFLRPLAALLLPLPFRVLLLGPSLLLGALGTGVSISLLCTLFHMDVFTISGCQIAQRRHAWNTALLCFPSSSHTGLLDPLPGCPIGTSSLTGLKIIISPSQNPRFTLSFRTLLLVSLSSLSPRIRKIDYPGVFPPFYSQNSLVRSFCLGNTPRTH